MPRKVGSADCAVNHPALADVANYAKPVLVLVIVLVLEDEDEDEDGGGEWTACQGLGVFVLVPVLEAARAGGCMSPQPPSAICLTFQAPPLRVSTDMLFHFPFIFPMLP